MSDLVSRIKKGLVTLAIPLVVSCGSYKTYNPHADTSNSFKAHSTPPHLVVSAELTAPYDFFGYNSSRIYNSNFDIFSSLNFRFGSDRISDYYRDSDGDGIVNAYDPRPYSYGPFIDMNNNGYVDSFDLRINSISPFYNYHSGFGNNYWFNPYRYTDHSYFSRFGDYCRNNNTRNIRNIRPSSNIKRNNSPVGIRYNVNRRENVNSPTRTLRTPRDVNTRRTPSTTQRTPTQRTKSGTQTRRAPITNPAQRTPSTNQRSIYYQNSRTPRAIERRNYTPSSTNNQRTTPQRTYVPRSTSTQRTTPRSDYKPRSTSSQSSTTRRSSSATQRTQSGSNQVQRSTSVRQSTRSPSRTTVKPRSTSTHQRVAPRSSRSTPSKSRSSATIRRN